MESFRIIPIERRHTECQLRERIVAHPGAQLNRRINPGILWSKEHHYGHGNGHHRTGTSSHTG